VSDSPETIAVPVISAPQMAHISASHASGSVHGDELVIASGAGAGERLLLTKDEMVAGRDVSADFLLDDVSVSRRHAIFTRTASGRISLRDLNSLNGTYVNGARVEEVILQSADDVQIGKYKLVFWATTL
jgi:pSer/pThr/pTyr-binding forkhead associated (FHA) protein